jgi:hypothetical protein
MNGIATLDPIEARFLAKVAPPDENGCHLWMAHTSQKGYGKFKYLGRMVQAHRYAVGMLDWPPEIQTRHICNVPACVNPEHLTFGQTPTTCGTVTRRAGKPDKKASTTVERSSPKSRCSRSAAVTPLAEFRSKAW